MQNQSPLATITPAKPNKGARFWQALVQLDFISSFFSWVMELLARVVEPLASLSAIYIIIVAGVPALENAGLQTLALALIIGSPELLIVGAFKIASREIAAGNKKGWYLIVSCCLLLLLTALTVADLFMWHWDAQAVNVLMGCRCLAGIAYSFTRGIVTDGSHTERSVPSALELFSGRLLASVQSEQTTLTDLVRSELNALRQQTMAELTTFIQQSKTELNALRQQFTEEQTALADAAFTRLESRADGAFTALVEQSQALEERAFTEEHIQRVTVTLEQIERKIEHILPTVNGKPQRLLPDRTTAKQRTAERSVNAASPLNDELSTSTEQTERSAGGVLTTQAKAYALAYFAQKQAWPTATMIEQELGIARGTAHKGITWAREEVKK